MDGLHVGLRVPLVGDEVGLGDSALLRLHGRNEGSQSVDLHWIAL